MNKWSTILALTGAVFSTPIAADWLDARCDIYPRGSDHVSKMIPCTFGQRQGYVTITRDDDVTHDLSPVGDQPGKFRDQDGRPVYRQSGLGDRGQIFRFEDESVYVYWDTSALNPSTSDEDNRTAPFTTADSAEPTTNIERVRFDAGTSGTEITASLTPGSSTRYVLGAKDGQFLYVRVAAQGKDISYQIFNPDNSFLLDQVSSAQKYRGQLWQSGDHVIEVINRGGSTSSYNVIFGIE